MHPTHLSEYEPLPCRAPDTEYPLVLCLKALADVIQTRDPCLAIQLPPPAGLSNEQLCHRVAMALKHISVNKETFGPFSPAQLAAASLPPYLEWLREILLSGKVPKECWPPGFNLDDTKDKEQKEQKPQQTQPQVPQQTPQQMPEPKQQYSARALEKRPAPREPPKLTLGDPGTRPAFVDPYMPAPPPPRPYQRNEASVWNTPVVKKAGQSSTQPFGAKPAPYPLPRQYDILQQARPTVPEPSSADRVRKNQGKRRLDAEWEARKAKIAELIEQIKAQRDLLAKTAQQGMQEPKNNVETKVEPKEEKKKTEDVVQGEPKGTEKQTAADSVEDWVEECIELATWEEDEWEILETPSPSPPPSVKKSFREADGQGYMENSHSFSGRSKETKSNLE